MQPHRPPRQGGRSSSCRALEAAALPILLVLLAANLAALVVHVWLFLPAHNDGDGGGAGAASRLASLFHAGSEGAVAGRRVRPQDVPHNNEATAALQTELSKEHVVRYDVVPRLLDIPPGTSYGVVHHLPSIPNRRRMLPTSDNGGGHPVPVDAVRNLTYFLDARSRPDEEDRPLFLYNPMLLPLNEDTLGGTIISDLSKGKEEGVAYVAAYRASNFGNCHGPGRGVPETYRNYLGVALLDKDLNIVRDASGQSLDVVIDLNQHLYEVAWSPHGGRRRPPKPKQYMQDCQLFAARSNDAEKADRLVLLCNEYAMPVRLERRRGEFSVHVQREESGEERIRFNNTYGTGLQLTALQHPIMILYGGKNMHHFEAAAGVDGRPGPAFLEIWPGGPHEVTSVEFGRHPFLERGSQLEMLKATKDEPPASFATVDAIGGGKQSPLIERDSGSACCVPVRWTDGDDGTEQRTLLLGFSHRKTRRAPKEGKYNYVSRVYAFDPLPPFDIVARSGFFCLGFAKAGSEEARQSDNEQVGGAANEYKLKIRDVEFDCPRIHFVTGIAEKVGDAETVIVSYGVNDCYPRMIEVPKTFLVGLLKPH